MNAAYLRPCRWVCSPTSSTRNLILIGLMLFAQTNGGEAAQGKTKVVAKMIDALANRNKPPKLVLLSSQKGRPPKLARRLPLFPKNYDWGAQDRVVKALSYLRQHMTSDLWEELVRKQYDPRYSLTMLNPFVESPDNWTVGDVCSDLAARHLVDVVRRHWPKKGGRTIGWRLGFTDLAEWRKQRVNKSLYELQIELVEQALAQLPEVKLVSQKTKEATRKKLESLIETLKRTKRPVFLKATPFDKSLLYTPQQAKRIRKALAEEKRR